jgi:phosphoribosylanthranilate isomerase
MIAKICGITNREDALAAAEHGASALGFNFYPKSPRYVDEGQAARIIEELAPTIWKVGVFVNERAERVVELAARIGLDVAQLHGDEGPEALPRGIRVWKAVSVNESFDATTFERYDVEAFLLDRAAPGLYGGTGTTFDWDRAAGLGKRVVIAGGLDAANVREAIRRARPWGVDACSRLESAPGKKDHAKMIAFLQAALSKENG